MSCDADGLATSFRMRMESGKVKPVKEGLSEPTVNASLLIKGAHVNSHCVHKIWSRAQGSKQCEHLQGKRAWSNKGWGSIDWQELKRAFQRWLPEAQGLPRHHQRPQMSSMS